MADLAGANLAWPPAVAGTNTPLCLGFLICKMGVITVPSSGYHCED